jgi:hypothetical protein
VPIQVAVLRAEETWKRALIEEGYARDECASTLGGQRRPVPHTLEWPWRATWVFEQAAHFQ